jgi:glycosyltransferase involved in cell wall biosynthesis
MKKFRVLHVLNNLDHGGAETYVLRLVRRLRRDRFESYLAYTCGGGLSDRFRRLQIGMLRMSETRLGFRRPFANLVAAWRAYRFVRRQRIGLIHAHLFEPYVWIAVVAAISGVPLFRTVVSNRRDAPPWNRPLERVFARITACLIVFTQVGRKELINLLRVPDRKIRVVPNGVDCDVMERIQEKDRESLRDELQIGSKRIVGTVGRLHPVKNHSMLLRAAAQVLRNADDVIFVIDGEGPLRSSLQAQAVHLGIADRTRFTGWSRDVHLLLSIFDVFALTSITEGAPTVLLEAMAFGVPVVATSVGGVPEILDHGCAGTLVAGEDEDGLVTAILGYLRDPVEADRMGQLGRKRCRRHYDSASMARQIEELYAMHRSDRRIHNEI